MIKMAFFDVDGTLSVPRFYKDGHYTIGFPPKEWKDFCQDHKDSAYKDCIPVQPVKRYAQKLKAEGARLFVLTASDKGEEESAKKAFIRKNFYGLFEELIITENGEEKISVILERAKRNHILPNECELIEDTYMTLLDAQEAGIQPTHISSIIASL